MACSTFGGRVNLNKSKKSVKSVSVLQLLDEDQVVSSARLKLKMAELLGRDKTVAKQHDAAVIYMEGLQCLQHLNTIQQASQYDVTKQAPHSLELPGQ